MSFHTGVSERVKKLAISHELLDLFYVVSCRRVIDLNFINIEISKQNNVNIIMTEWLFLNGILFLIY